MKITSKWLYTALFISVALNVFSLSYYLSSRSSLTPQSISNLTIPEMKNIFKSIPIENREQMRELLKSHQREIIVNREQIRVLRLQMALLLEQDPLDQKKLTELFEKIYQLSIKNTALAQQTIYQTLIQLPLNERLKLAKAIESSGNRNHSRKHFEKNG
ncbi:MAG: periplasmic heavy metal sensor [Candidatus Berkiellales bacterium]